LRKDAAVGTIRYALADLRFRAGTKDRTVSRPIVIHADWDPGAEVWVATTQDLRGLVTEAETVEALRAKLPGMILGLLEENGVSDLPASIEIIARASDRLVAAE
jgi:predicted RNase H-like HicB family nuclease